MDTDPTSWLSGVEMLYPEFRIAVGLLSQSLFERGREQVGAYEAEMAKYRAERDAAQKVGCCPPLRVQRLVVCGTVFVVGGGGCLRYLGVSTGIGLIVACSWVGWLRACS